IHSVLGDAKDIDLTKLNSTDFDRFAQAARENLGQGAAYTAGRGLKNLADFLINKKILKPFKWKSPIKKQKELNAVDDEIDK
ncbi:hypothetical protein CWC28_21715, partial [Pseudoalteromonas sp. S4492]|uniref:hypothetical protein n=1 Tax=Pseudoalteromonas sp. S4492 TaxID=579560 RepID=UPI001285BD4B